MVVIHEHRATPRRAYLRVNEFARDVRDSKFHPTLEHEKTHVPDLSLQPKKSILRIKECHVCKKPITDSDEIVALGKSWHSGHFQCSHCGTVLNPSSFCDMDNLPYCERDFNLLFRIKCDVCTKPIIEQPLKLLGRNWHSLCFTCTECDKQLNPKSFFERGGYPFCEEDYHRLFSPACYSCQNPIKKAGDLTGVLNRTYHNECFVCLVCKKQLFVHNFKAVDGQIYCVDDYHSLFSPRCTGCREPIKDAPLIALGNQYHEDCFTCKNCNNILSDRHFVERDGNAFCKRCDLDLFAPRCTSCREPIDGEAVLALGAKWHPACFTCRDCNFVLNEKTFHEIDGEAYCPQHFHSRTCKDCVKIRRAQDKYWGDFVGEPKNTIIPLRRAASHSSVFYRDYAFQEIPDEFRSSSAMF